MSHAKIVDHPALYRDMDTQHIINTDLSVVRKHEARVLNMNKETAQAQEIASLRSDLEEIKSLLKSLVGTGK